METSKLSEKKFEELYNRLSKKLYLSSYNLTNNKELSEDLVHETFMSLWQSRNDFDAINNADNYLFGVLKNKVYTAYRKKKFDTVYLDNKFDHYIQNELSEDEIANSLLLSRMDTLIELLPEKRKNVFKMSRFQKKSTDQIALELNLSHQTVKNQIYAAMQFLKSNLKNEIVLCIISAPIF